jgi:GWxTD domain-containing protein
MTSSRLSLLTLAMLAAAAVPAAAQKMDKDDKTFLELVEPILLDDEEKFYKGLKDKADRQEFQKIFWARRDPDVATPENEFRADYEKAKAEADAAYKVMGRAGSLTDCGRVYILLGKPDDVRKEGTGASPGLRQPETWTYRDRPNQKFAGGQAQVSFDSECRLPEGAGLLSQLQRVAGDRVLHPNLEFRKDKDGRIVKLVDLLPKPSPARTLLAEGRHDFPLETQPLFLKVTDGGTALLGVVRGSAAGLTPEDKGGKKTVKVVVAAAATDEEGKEAAQVEHPTWAEVMPDGHFVASYRLTLRPGKYTVKAAVLDEKTGRGAVAEAPAQAPDYRTGELSMASIMLLREVRDVPGGQARPDAAFAAFSLGPAELVPYGTPNLTKADTPSVFYQVYDLKVDEASGKAQAVATVSISKAGKTIAEAPSQPIETPIGGNAVGPIPLDKYEPGTYTVQLKVSDKLAKKDKVQEIAFEIKP